MRVCFDTCTIIDIFGKTDSFFAAYCAYDVAVALGFQPCISVSSTTDVCYLLHSRGYLSSKKARSVLRDVFRLLEPFGNAPSDCQLASESNMSDYEDALIAYSALNADVDLIVTNNKKDFKNSPVPALTPEEFLRDFKPENLEYDEVSF